MFKLGVYKPQQIERERTKSIFGAKKRISVTLLEDIRAGRAPDSALPEIMYTLNDDRGTFKRTYTNRFDKFDERCVDEILHHFSRSDLSVHDVAVSSGETAVDFFDLLQGRFTALSYLATDYDPTVTVLRQGPFQISVASSGSVIEILAPPFVLTPQTPDRWFYPINNMLSFFLRQFVAEPAVRRYRSDELPERATQEIDLFCPRAIELATNDPRFSTGKYDLLNRMDAEYDCIRAMNVLNRGYFGDEEFRKILANIYGSLCNGGLFIVGSNLNEGSPVSGGIYEKTGTGFASKWATGGQAEVSRHVDRFNHLLTSSQA